MIYMIGKDSLPKIAQCSMSIANLGMLVGPGNLWQNPVSAYACDNGVYAQFIRGRQWDQEMHEQFVRMLEKVDRQEFPPLWILAPDAVGDWDRTVELAGIYLPLLKGRGFRTCVALQDGCDFEQARELETDAVFVAGSTEWKEANIHRVREEFADKWVHVGRVNTARRLRLCQSAGVDSCDGTTLNKFIDKTLPLIAATLNQPCLAL